MTDADTRPRRDGRVSAAPAVRAGAHRRAYIDVARGLAVLLMIEAHTTDAWTRAAAKHSPAFRNATILGGFAAPLFLWLAGVAVVLAAGRAEARSGSRATAVDGICRRGLEIFILAFLFRLQAFMLSPGAHPITLFRVDILNVMGPAIVFAALAWLVTDSKVSSTVLFSLLATAVAMATPLVRHLPVVDRLPLLLQWYVRPSGDNTTFTSFPWIGFVFAGAAVGTLLTAVRDKRVERLLLGTIGIAGVIAVAGGFYAASLPSIYRDSSFWTTSPAYFAIRAGVLMIALVVLYGVEEILHVAAAPMNALARFGRSSLFVYWIHVELVYGYASWMLRRHLPLWGTFAAYAVFTLLMFGAVVLRDYVVERWRHRNVQMSLQYKAEAV